MLGFSGPTAARHQLIQRPSPSREPSRRDRRGGRKNESGLSCGARSSAKQTHHHLSTTVQRPCGPTVRAVQSESVRAVGTRGPGSWPLQAWTVSPKTLSSSTRATWFSPQASLFCSSPDSSPPHALPSSLHAHLLLRSLEDHVCKQLLRFNLNVSMTTQRTYW